jgi:heavy metal sensor kinase
MRVWPRSLRWRLTLWYTALLAGLLAVLGTAALVLLDRGLRQNVDTSLESLAQTVADSARKPATVAPDLEALLESLLGPAFARRFFELLDPRGRPDSRWPAGGEGGLPPLSRAALENAMRGEETYETVALPEGSGAPVRVLTFPVLEDGRLVHLARVALSLESAETARARFLLILLGLAPVALLGAAAGGWLLARRALAPLDAMVETARRIGAEDLSRRIEAAGSDDELGRLAAVLNDMLGRLERSFTVVRHFSADAAHELRTPLTILTGEIEVALRSAGSPEEYRAVLASALEEVHRLSALVEDLLFLARSDAGALSPPRTPVDLGAVVEDALPALRALADGAGVRLEAPPGPAVRVRGNQPMLFRAVFNLVENAIKYTGAGGTVEVRLSGDDGRAVVAVRDTGPGIPVEDRERIFDRFQRGDPARERGGTGLGLALARSIALVHEGRIALESTPGEGSCFSLVLPLMEGSEPEPVG